MPKATPKTAPEMMPGRVIAQRVKCSKAGCKCSRGEPHTAHYRYWTEDGRQRKAYVKRGEVAATRAACRRWKEADAVKATILDSPDTDRPRAEMRATLRESLGAQIDTAGGRRELRRLRSRGEARRWVRPDPLESYAAESLAGLFAGLGFSFFRFGK